jgi:hypothetical protein
LPRDYYRIHSVAGCEDGGGDDDYEPHSIDSSSCKLISQRRRISALMNVAVIRVLHALLCQQQQQQTRFFF